MDEANGEYEIEYLDEDEDLVQQVLGVDIVEQPAQKTSPLLIEKVPKRKKKITDDDDYSPTREISLKKRKVTAPVSKIKMLKSRLDATPVKASESRKSRSICASPSTMDRRLKDIVIPDYEDPLCLPVKSIARDADDVKKVKNWNNLCINRLEYANVCLRPEKGDTARSSRTIVLRNMKHKVTGKIDTTVWSKVSVENRNNDRKSEVFQCVLPKFREKKILTYFLDSRKKTKQSVRTVNEVILCKEDSKEDEQLVTYMPKSHVVAVYKTFMKVDANEKEEVSDETLQKDRSKRYLKEMTNVKMCGPCYQTSWRGQQSAEKKNIRCTICQRSYVSVYNLLAHVNTGHSDSDVRRHKARLSAVLAQIVNYHYRCRICGRRLGSIRELRRHVAKHAGTEEFFCEIGNHITK